MVIRELLEHWNYLPSYWTGSHFATNSVSHCSICDSFDWSHQKYLLHITSMQILTRYSSLLHQQQYQDSTVEFFCTAHGTKTQKQMLTLNDNNATMWHNSLIFLLCTPNHNYINMPQSPLIELYQTAVTVAYLHSYAGKLQIYIEFN